MSLFYLKWVLIQQFRGSQKIISPVERINPSEKAFNTMKKSRKQQWFHKRARTHVISLYWNGDALSRAVGFGGRRGMKSSGGICFPSLIFCALFEMFSQTLKTSPFCLWKHTVFFSVLGSALQNASGQHLKAQDTWWQGWKLSVFHCSQAVSKQLLF